jgi:hypothetical protein
MAHARQVDRGIPQATIAVLAGIAAAIVVAGVLAFTAFDALDLQRPPVIAPEAKPALIEAGRAWELQRHAETGYVDPDVRSGRDWEQERRQQSGAIR